MFSPIPPETSRLRASFDEKWIEDGECRRWLSFRRSKEYGGFQIGYRTYRAHRVAYVWAYGEPHCDLHHICGNAWCVHPEHITPAASEQPHHRGPSPNFCAHSHEFTPENTYVNPRGERQCRICLREASLRYIEANRAEINEKRRKKRVRIVHEPRLCIECSASFVPIRSTKKYCSERCQATANNRKQYQKRRV